MNSNETIPRKGGILTKVAVWLFSRRGLKAVLIILVWVVTMVFLAYAIENWRGKKAWNAVKADLDKRGEVWEFSKVVPKPVPADQNFASLPLVTNWFDRAYMTNSVDDKHPLSIAKTKLGREKRDRTHLMPFEPTDLVAWAKAIELGTNSSVLNSALDIPPTPQEEATPEARAQAARVVLAAMAADQRTFAELQEALHRPYSCYPIDYTKPDPWSILLPHLAKVKMWSQRLALKASADLALGKTDEALKDIEVVLGLEGSLKSEPFLISYLVRIAILKVAVQPVWEGLQEHRWNDEQLRRLIERFAKYDFLPDLQAPLATERAATVKTLEMVRRHGDLAGNITDAGPVGVSLARLLPSGWYYFEMANYSKIMDRLLWDGLDLKGRRVHPDILEKNAKWFESGRASEMKELLRHELAARMFLPALSKAIQRGTQGQALADFAALACALERYRIKTGQLPDALQALTPDYLSALPKDWITGQAYPYRKTDSSFALYSVGWDQEDDGGDTKVVKGEETKGDWVWGYVFP